VIDRDDGGRQDAADDEQAKAIWVRWTTASTSAPHEMKSLRTTYGA
jgi:hypothetical protein